MQLNIGALVTYASVSAPRRVREAQRISLQSEGEYAVETDFWKQMRAAIVRDRKFGRDGGEVRGAAAAATSKKQASYTAVADMWTAFVDRWSDSSYAKPGVAVVSVGELDVSVRPHYSEVWPDGRVENVYVWMNHLRPSEEAVRCALQLLGTVEPGDLVTFVDVRRGQVWSEERAVVVDLRSVETAAHSLLRDSR